MSAIGIYDKTSTDDCNFNNEDLLGSVLKVEFVKGEPNDNGKQYLELKPWTCEAIGGLATPKAKGNVVDEEEIPGFSN